MKKLLKTSNFGDLYIGLKLFDELPIKEQRKFVKENTKKGGKGYTYSWITEPDEYAWDIPEEYHGSYIKGKYYSYVIQSLGIMIDAPYVFKRYSTRKIDTFKVLEDWTK